jgi:nicotinamide mononucleotide adenylyltransferase
MAISKLGVVHGRFQIFHLSHLKYVLAGKRRCKKLIVGITSPDPFISPVQMVDPDRGKLTSNPCTYYERAEMIEAALLEADVKLHEFQIVPFPIEFPERIKYYVPIWADFYITIYDDWGEEKLTRLQNLNFNVIVLWRSPVKSLTATMVRQAIAERTDWKKYVPPSVAEKIISLGIENRLINSFPQKVDHS